MDKQKRGVYVTVGLALLLGASGLANSIYSRTQVPQIKHSVPATNYSYDYASSQWRKNSRVRALAPTDMTLLDVNQDGFLDALLVDSSGATYVDLGHIDNAFIPLSNPITPGDWDIESNGEKVSILNQTTGDVYSFLTQNLEGIKTPHLEEILDIKGKGRVRLELDANGNARAQPIIPDPIPLKPAPETEKNLPEENYLGPRPAPHSREYAPGRII